MKKTFFFVASLTSLVSLVGCGVGGGSSASLGELVGIKRSIPKPEYPYGMVYVPTGTFVMGQVDQDISYSQVRGYIDREQIIPDERACRSPILKGSFLLCFDRQQAQFPPEAPIL